MTKNKHDIIINNLFSSHGSLDASRSVLKDLASDNGRLGPKSIWSLAKLAIRNPVSAVRFARSLSDESFQESLLQNENIWNHLDSVAPDVIKYADNIVRKFAFDTKSKGSEDKNENDATTISDKLVTQLRDNTRLHKLLADNAEKLQDLAVSLRDYKPVRAMLDDYGVSDDAFSLIPWMAKNPSKTLEIYDAFQPDSEGKYAIFMHNVETILDIASKDEELGKFLREHPRAILKASISYLDSYPEWSDSMGLRTGALNVVAPLLHDAKVAKDVVSAYNKGEYQNLASMMISEMNKPDSQLLLFLQDEKNKTAFIASMKKIIDSNSDLKATLEEYGIKDGDIEAAKAIFDIIEKNPKEVQKIFESFKQQDYTQAIIDLVTLSKTSPELKEYLKSNKVLVGTLANKMLHKQLPYLNAGSVAQNIMDNITSRPDDVIKLLHSYRKGGIKGAAEMVLNSATLNVAASTLHDTTLTAASVAKDKIANYFSGFIEAFSGAQKASVASTSHEVSDKRDISADIDKLTQDISGYSFKNCCVRDVRFDSKDITNSEFSDTDISHCSFKSCNNIINVDFTGAKLNNVSFAGSKIDDSTMRTILDPSTTRHNVSLAGVIISADVLKDAALKSTPQNPIDIKRAIIIGNIDDIDKRYITNFERAKYIPEKDAVSAVKQKEQSVSGHNYSTNTTPFVLKNSTQKCLVR